MASDPTRPGTLHVICFGNELHADDGFGPAVHARLAHVAIPPHVRLMRADLAGLAAIGCFDGCARAIIVDALQGFGPPGSVHQLDAATITADAACDEAPAGFHGAGVGRLLQLLPAALEHVPPIQLIGTEVGRVAAFAPGLSPAVAGAVDVAAARVQRQWS